MIRRDFIGKAAVSVAALSVGAIVAKAADAAWKPLDTGKVLRVFKRGEQDGFETWTEIQWDTMRKGNQVICFGVAPGETLVCDSFVCAADPEKTDDGNVLMFNYKNFVKDCLAKEEVL